MVKSYDSGDKIVAGCGSHMQSFVTIDETGTIHLKTHTFTHCKAAGFTGGTCALFSDNSGKVIYQTPTESYGVDGEWVFFKDSDRWDEKIYHVDPSIYNNTYRIDVLVFHNPHNRFAEDFPIIIDVVSIVVKIIEVIISVFGSSAGTSGSSTGTGDTGDYTFDAGNGSTIYGSYKQHLTISAVSSQVIYGGKIVLQTYNGTNYVCAENGGGREVVANRTEAREWETFKIIGPGGKTDGSIVKYGDNISLQTYNGTNYVCAENGGGKEVVANRTEAHEWETFKIIGPGGKTDGSPVQNGGKISLQTYNGTNYVCAENGGGKGVIANRTEAREWETFTVYIT